MRETIAGASVGTKVAMSRNVPSTRNRTRKVSLVGSRCTSLAPSAAARASRRSTVTTADRSVASSNSFGFLRHDVGRAAPVAEPPAIALSVLRRSKTGESTIDFLGRAARADAECRRWRSSDRAPSRFRLRARRPFEFRSRRQSGNRRACRCRAASATATVSVVPTLVSGNAACRRATFSGSARTASPSTV